MVKRPNEDSESSQPKAKRTISGEEEALLKIKTAQDAMDRIDFKTAGEICTEVSKRKRRQGGLGCALYLYLNFVLLTRFWIPILRALQTHF